MVLPLPWISFSCTFYKAGSVTAFSLCSCSSMIALPLPPLPLALPRVPLLLSYKRVCPSQHVITDGCVTYLALLLDCVMFEFVGILIQCSESIQLSHFFANLHLIPHCVNSHVLIFFYIILALNSQAAVSFCLVNVHGYVFLFSHVKSTRITNVKARETVLLVSASIVSGT